MLNWLRLRLRGVVRWQGGRARPLTVDAVDAVDADDRRFPS